MHLVLILLVGCLVMLSDWSLFRACEGGGRPRWQYWVVSMGSMGVAVAIVVKLLGGS